MTIPQGGPPRKPGGRRNSDNGVETAMRLAVVGLILFCLFGLCWGFFLHPFFDHLRLGL